MQPLDFTEDKAGRLIRAPEGYWAFAPDPLPPPIRWTPNLVRRLAEAERALGRLDVVGWTLPNPHLLIDPFVRREAVLSSRIEGTEASLSDLFLFEAKPSTEDEVPDVREVGNYVRALNYGLERLSNLPLSLRLFREIHERLMAGVRGDQMTPGEFRRTQNWIGPPGCTLNEATFVPPPVHEMKECLGQLETHLRASDELPPLVRLGLVHYQFEAIHPFLDGNGRLGRLIITMLLCAGKLLSQPLLYLSSFFEKHRDAYYHRLLRVSLAGEWEAWLSFFLEGVAEQAADGVERADRLLSLRQGYHDKLQTVRASALPIKLVDALFSSPIVSAPHAARLLDVTPASARASINKLIKTGILEEITGRARNRMYVAKEILDTVSD